MDFSVAVFDILLDVFFVLLVFAIYLYVLFRYFIHSFEEIGILKFFKIHLSFYKPLVNAYKLSNTYLNNKNYLMDRLENKIANVNEIHANTDYSIANYAIIGYILGLFVITVVYFTIFRHKIMQQLSLKMILIKFVITLGVVLMFELLFLFYVYGNWDLFNLAKGLGILDN